MKTFWRCFLSITKSWGKLFVEETIKLNKGVCTPAPLLTYLIFKLSLIYLYHIHQVIYHIALDTCCLHLFAAPLPFAFPQYLGAPTDFQRGGIITGKAVWCYSPLTGHAAIVCASCSLSKCGINAGYLIINITEQTTDCCSYRLSSCISTVAAVSWWKVVRCWFVEVEDHFQNLLWQIRTTSEAMLIYPGASWCQKCWSLLS